MRPCYKFTAKTAKKPAVLALDDEIGFWGTQAKDFRAALDAIPDNALDVEINSPGGDVFAGLAMYNMLRTWAAQEGRAVTTRVTGVAASIASVIALAGDRREMPKNAFAMVHSVSSFAWGTADELREAAETTDKIQASLRNIYQDRMGIDEAKATEIMAKDTWLTAEECKDMGFATHLTDAVTATAKFDLARAELPEHVAAVFKAQVDKTPADAPTPEPTVEPQPEPGPEDVPDTPEADQIVAKAKTAGLEAYGPLFAVACTSVAEAETRIASARQIVALCNVAGRPDDAKAAIKNNTPIADVRAALATALAEDDTHIDTSRKAEGNPNPGGKAVASSKDVFAKRAAARKQSK